MRQRGRRQVSSFVVHDHYVNLLCNFWWESILRALIVSFLTEAECKGAAQAPVYKKCKEKL